MNINNKPSMPVEQNNKVNNTLEHSQLQKKSPQSQQADKATSSTSQVSELSKSIDSTFETLSSQTDVDMEKVAEVKAAIANGELILDEETLINALLELHRQ
jgi:negative regulator of flagellin synthesis FlgM